MTVTEVWAHPFYGRREEVEVGQDEIKKFFNDKLAVYETDVGYRDKITFREDYLF